MKKNCDADPMARLFVAYTKAANVPGFNPPSMTTEKVVHEGEDVSADSVPYILPLEYSNKPSESDEGIPPRVRGMDVAVGDAYARDGITPACAGNRYKKQKPLVRFQDHPRVCGE